MVRSFNLALTGAARRLSDVYGDGNGVVNAIHDIPYKGVVLQAQTGAIQIGGDPAVDGLSATIYGLSLAIDANLSLTFPGGPLYLSQYWAFGTGTLHILGLPY